MPGQDLGWEVLALAIAGSVLAGFINTLAGNGSAITLTVLTELLGLPPLVANGTNRVGALAASATSTLTYLRGGKLNWSAGARLLLPVGIGGILGGLLATQVSNAAFKAVFQYMLVVLLIVVLLKPKRWLQQASARSTWPPWLIIGVGLLVGAYGGFIQMGFGPLFLAFAVLGAGLPLAEANVYKVAVVAIYTPVLLIAFAMAGQLHWAIGMLMAVGQAAAAFATTRFAIASPRAGQVAYVVLVIVVVGAVVRLFVAP